MEVVGAKAAFLSSIIAFAVAMPISAFVLFGIFHHTPRFQRMFAEQGIRWSR